jgi:hypothetical protein
MASRAATFEPLLSIVTFSGAPFRSIVCSKNPQQKIDGVACLLFTEDYCQPIFPGELSNDLRRSVCVPIGSCTGRRFLDCAPQGLHCFAKVDCPATILAGLD